MTTPSSNWLVALRGLMFDAPTDPTIRHLGCVYVAEHLGIEPTENALGWLKHRAIGRLSDCLFALHSKGTALSVVHVHDPKPDPPPPDWQSQLAVLTGPGIDPDEEGLEFGVEVCWGDDIPPYVLLAALPLEDGRMWALSERWTRDEKTLHELPESSTESILATGVLSAFRAQVGAREYLLDLVRDSASGVPYLVWKEDHGHPLVGREPHVLQAIRQG